MRRPPIFSSRPDQELFNRVSQRFKEMGAMTVTAEQKEAIDRLLETEVVSSALSIEGAELSEELITASLEAYAVIKSLVETKGRQAEITPDSLSKLAPHGGGFRKGPSAASHVAAEHLPLILEGACRWFSAESFAELNPAEQAAIVMLRLIELQPFERANGRLALIAASLFTMRSGLPPVIFRPEQRGSCLAAIDEGLQANTKPLVELIAESLERSLARMIEVIEKG